MIVRQRHSGLRSSLNIRERSVSREVKILLQIPIDQQVSNDRFSDLSRELGRRYLGHPQTSRAFVVPRVYKLQWRQSLLTLHSLCHYLIKMPARWCSVDFLHLFRLLTVVAHLLAVALCPTLLEVFGDQTPPARALV